MNARNRIVVFDTTLRDGAQMPGGSLELRDKVSIARALSAAGVPIIEAGLPAAGPHELDAVRAVVGVAGGATVAALARAVDSDIDAAALALEAAPRFGKVVNVFVPTSPVHREKKLGKTRAEVLALIARGVGHARKHFSLVGFGAEDASRTEPEFLREVYQVAIEAGATAIAFADTLGTMTPERVKQRIGDLQATVHGIERVLVGVHFHDDLGLATANCLAAISAGARVVQCTVNGVGERAGNASLEEVVIAVRVLQEEVRARTSVDPRKLLSLSRLVAEAMGTEVPRHKAVVGENVFSTEAGIHQDGLLKDPATYLPYPAEWLGLDGVRLVLGKNSGRAAIEARLRALGFELSGAHVDRVVSAVKAAPARAWDGGDDLLLRTVSATAGAE